jgi:apolipoprotein N-acyltransferase
MNASVSARSAAESAPRENPAVSTVPALSWKKALSLAAAAVVAFHLSYESPPLDFLILVYLYCLFLLATLPTARRAFYFGVVIGYAVYAPHLAFFWTIFGWPAAALWTVLAFWLGLFVALARLCRRRFGRFAVVLVPFVWTGLEYFRSELYYLRFSWLNVGFAFADSPQMFSATHLGVYGVGLALMMMATVLSLFSKTWAGILLGVFLVALGCFESPGNQPDAMPAAGRIVQVAGMQMEFPAQVEVPSALDQLSTQFPEAELLTLSEYTFDGPVPERVKSWCRLHKKYLIAGGKDFISSTGFYNTAFVVGPDGEIVFRQVKSVPIQFFKDGRPASEQKLWDSPWGKVGLCVCYDLSYRRVTEELIRQGAQAIIAPTMDVADWGAHQHKLHARVAPVRGAEYGVPVFRVCSSGISQLIDPHGRMIAAAPFPGDRATIAGPLELVAEGRLPLDHWLAPFSVMATAVIVLWLSVKTVLGKFSRL